MRLKPVSMFWLTVAALAFQTLFQGRIGFLYTIGLTIIAVIVFTPSFFAHKDDPGRVPFLLDGAAVGFSAARAWGVYGGDFIIIFDWFLLLIQAVMVIALGYAAFKRSLQRAMVVLGVLTLGVVYFLGSRSNFGGDQLAVMLICLVLIPLILGALWIFTTIAEGFAAAGAEDAQRMKDGRPPKHGPPPF